jgi:insulysin
MHWLKQWLFVSLQYGRGLKNFVAEQPHQHAVYFTSVVMSELLWTQVELLNSLEGLYVVGLLLIYCCDCVWIF